MRNRIETPREVSAFVHRLGERIGNLVRGRDRVALAFSGGLASTLVAMVARKRCDLDCLVAGSEESADVRAARAAKQHMDYRIELVLLDAAETRRIRDCLAAPPGLSPRGIQCLIPLLAVVERAERLAWLAGFGSARVRPEIIAAFQRLGVRAPLLDLSAGGTVLERCCELRRSRSAFRKNGLESRIELRRTERASWRFSERALGMPHPREDYRHRA